MWVSQWHQTDLRFFQVSSWDSNKWQCPAWCPLGTPVTKNKPGTFMCVCAYITRWVVTGILLKGNIWASFFYTSWQSGKEGRRESWRWSGFSEEPRRTMRDADIKWRAPLASDWPSKNVLWCTLNNSGLITTHSTAKEGAGQDGTAVCVLNGKNMLWACLFAPVLCPVSVQSVLKWNLLKWFPPENTTA